MSKHVHLGEKCGKRMDGDPAGESDGRTDAWTNGRTDGDLVGHHHTIIRVV